MTLILIVDDNKELVDLFTLILDNGGYEVRSAGNGQEALALALETPPDLVLLDIMMEPMDGREVLKRLRAMPENTWTPIVMITGKEPTAEEVEQYGDLIDGYILKPVTTLQFMAIVGESLQQQRRVRDQIATFRAAGADDAFVDEYRLLSRKIWVGHQFHALFSRLGSEHPTDLYDLETRLDTITQQIRTG
jgi:two-component system OmpR family response regulator